MASNNRKAPPRWPPKNTEDRSRHAASRAPQTGGSLHAKRRIDNKKVQETLDDMFVNVFDSEIIRSVAHSCGWKLNKSIEALIMLAEGSEFPKTDSCGNKNSFQSFFVSSSDSNDKASASKSKCAKNNSKTDKSIMNETSNDNVFTSTPLNRFPQSLGGKSVMMNASQGAIKVTYRGQDDADLSDDDADVVIEEENEFDVSELDLGYPDVSTQSMYQFLTPFVSTNQSRNDGIQHSFACASKQNISSAASNKLPGKSRALLNLPQGVSKSPDKTPVKKTKHWPKFERIKRQINDGIKIMVLMRGCPGSGKTSLARHIIKYTYGENDQKYIFSTDNYFVYLGNGKYTFEPHLLPSAHKWNQQKVNEEVKKETTPIIIDNTNLEAWEMEPYVRMAVEHGYNLEFLEPRTSWRNNSFELERKNTHGISRRKIEDMLARFEHDLTPAKMLFLVNLKYAPNNSPPQYTSQRKTVERGEDDSQTNGAKKKLKMNKKNEGKSSKKIFESSSQHNKSDFTEKIQFSEGFGTNIADKEIKESIDTLFSEWVRSVSAASEQMKTVSPEASACVQEGGAKTVHNFSVESGIENAKPMCNSSGNMPMAERRVEPINQDVKIFANLDGEIAASDEMDFMTDTTENSEEMEMGSTPDDWECRSGDDTRLQCNDPTILYSCKETVNTKSSEEEGKEYVLVLNDGTLLPQRSYHKENTSLCPLKESRRVWEYLLMTDDDSNLYLHSTKNNTSENSDTKDSTQVFSNSSEGEAHILNSLKQMSEKDTETTENTFLQKIATEEPSLECLLFHNVDVEDILNPDSVSEGIECEDATMIAQTESSSKDLDLLVTEGAASLNIAFAGMDYVRSLRKSCLFTEKSVVGNKDIKSAHTAGMETSVCNSLQNGSAESMLVPVGEDSFNTASETENKEICQTNMLSNSMNISSCSDNTENAINEESVECSASPGLPEIEFQVAEMLRDDCTMPDSEVRRNTNIDLSYISISQEKQSPTHENDLKDPIANSCPIASKDKISEIDILEEWAGGIGWDEQEPSTSANVDSHPKTCTPKPARNYKRPVSVELCSQKKRVEEGRVDASDVVANESWSAVEEPVVTWEVENVSLDKNQQKPSLGDEPQPQRKVFSVTLEGGSDKEKIDVELRQSTDGTKSEECSAVTKVTSSKLISDNNGVLNVAENVELWDQVPTISPMTIDTKPRSSAQISSLLTIPNYSSGAGGSNSFNTTLKSQKHVIHSSTNTHHADFIILNNANMGSEVEVPGIKIISAVGRNIVGNDVMAGSKQNVRNIGQILMLDKSSMTYDIISSIPETENLNEQLEELVTMFPHCRFEDLLEIFEKCNRDINWTVDLLLESASQGIEISTPNSTRGVEPETGVLVELSTTNNEMVDNVHASIESSNNASPFFESLTIPNNSVHLTSTDQESVKSLTSKRNGKKDRILVSKTSMLLKRQLEETIVINEEHYSEHVSRLRKIRHGEVADLPEVSGCTQEMGENLNENTQPQSLLDISPDEMQLQHTNDPGTMANFILRPEAPEWEVNDMESKDMPDEEEEAVALKMDSGFADQLHNLFGTASLPFNQDMKPTLNLPLSLARQLHYYMMEAEQNTYDLMMQEDEELARKLQVQEDKVSAEAIVSTVQQVPDLREIMDMEMALALYKTDQKQSNPESKEDLATKLTKNLLCEWFPSLPKDILINVFEAHNRSFEETLDVLLASTEEDNSVRTVMTPEARAAHEMALLKKASLEGEKNKNSLRPYLMDTGVSQVHTQEQALLDAKYFRSEASRHYDLRNECQNKAQKAYKRGLTAAASYYSQMASLHKERIEENNARAASSLLLAHSLGNLQTTLDLHFLYVVEALQVLDMFLDHHIHQLLDSSYRSVPVFVITGRGARSSGGRSRIKPAVVQRLEQRGLRHEEVNPGLLKVIVTRNATSSSRISS